MLNCKVGDLAIITKPARNLARIVEVVLWVGTNNLYSDTNLWLVTTPKDSRPLVTRRGELSHKGLISDKWLKPVSGLSDDESKERSLEYSEPQHKQAEVV